MTADVVIWSNFAKTSYFIRFSLFRYLSLGLQNTLEATGFLNARSLYRHNWNEITY